MALSGGKTFLVFNDKKSKAERKRDDLKGSSFTDLVVIDGMGMIEYRETIFTNRDTDLDFVTSMSGSGYNHMLIGSESSRRFSFGLLQLQ
ncbi:MAG: hypothetical protein HKN67_14530 [Saprospiraceae bacterium]|nr:hypothetical protein [Saprospiraceae bacterium]